MFERQRGHAATQQQGLTAAPTRSLRQSPPAPGLRQPRHAGLFEAVGRLDVAGLDQAARAELSEWIRDQYSSSYGSVPVGFVAACHLGVPYVDHFLNLMMSIVDHFAAADAMPEPFAAARMLARNSAYAFVEVHDGGLLVPIRPDGSAVA